MKIRPPRSQQTILALYSTMCCPSMLLIEDVKGARRMPWRRKSTKGAASRDSPGGGADGLRSRGARMGEPAGGNAPAPGWRTHSLPGDNPGN